jgi:ribA/ribD-fused uncharacterized protein
MTEKFTLFYSGPFSQWHRSPFTIGKDEYNCAEQFMMAEKAKLFGDDNAWNAIMSTNDPRRQKAIGRSVIGFDPVVWEKNAKLIVYRGSYAKFMQNKDLRHHLLCTIGSTIVEASPTDTIWGIGLSGDNPDCHDRTKWKGTNWLGEVLTLLRIDSIGE